MQENSVKLQGFDFTHTKNLLLVKELNLSKLVVVVGLISLVLQRLRDSGLRLESCLELVQVCLCHLLLLTVFVVLQEEGEREREECTYVNVTRHYLHVSANLDRYIQPYICSGCVVNG